MHQPHDGHASTCSYLATASSSTQASSKSRVLLVGGEAGGKMGALGDSVDDDVFSQQVRAALHAAGLLVETAAYSKRKEQQLADRLTHGGYGAAIVLGLGSGTSFVPSRPTSPWADGTWRRGLVEWVASGGMLLMQGERAAAAVLADWFGKVWRMDGDYYRRTEHCLHACAHAQG